VRKEMKQVEIQKPEMNTKRRNMEAWVRASYCIDSIDYNLY
jgi:hypothetical protein